MMDHRAFGWGSTDGTTKYRLGGTWYWISKSLNRVSANAIPTFGGNGLFSLAALIALMLFAAESSNGALASHSSTPIVALAGVGESICVWIRRGGTRVEVIVKIVRTPVWLPGGKRREWIDFSLFLKLLGGL